MIRKGLFILIGIMAIASASLALQPIYADDGITIETDNDVYNHSSTIILTGHITVVDQNEVPVVIMVISPNGNIANIAQVSVDSDGVFSTTFNTAGAMMRFDGTYQIQASYGFVETTISIELTNAIESAMTSDTMETAETTLEDAIKDGQINWTIDGGVITSFFVNGDENSIVLYITIYAIFNDVSLHPSGMNLCTTACYPTAPNCHVFDHERHRYHCRLPTTIIKDHPSITSAYKAAGGCLDVDYYRGGGAASHHHHQ